MRSALSQATSQAPSQAPPQAPKPSAPAAPSLDDLRQIPGCFDTLTNGACTGWAWDFAQPDGRARVDVLIRGSVAMTVTAEEYREDLHQMGLGDGRHGFRIDLTRFLVEDGEEIHLVDHRTRKPLLGSPRRFVRPLGFFDRFAVTAPSESGRSHRFDRAENAFAVDYGELLTVVEDAKKHGVPVFVHAPLIEWNTPLFQRPQHMAAALARQGAVSIYCSAKMRYDVFEGTWCLSDRLYVTDRFDELRATLTGCWFDFYSTSPWPIDALRKVAARNNVIYEYVDHIDEEISGTGAQLLLETFSSLDSKTVRLFVPTAVSLRDELVRRFGAEDVLLNPNGTEIEHFRKALADPRPVPAMEAIKAKRNAPIAGYYGALAQWLDYDLIARLARQLPDWEFVFIGPVYDYTVQLPQAANLHWLGAVAYEELPTYARYFDVATIPFKPGQIARTTSPLKLFEYFALEKPVVVQSAMDECVAFDIVKGASTAEDYAVALQQALRDGQSPSYRAKARALAEANSWDVRAADLVEAMRRRSRRNGPSLAVDPSIEIALTSGNLETRRRMPACQLRRAADGFSFWIDEATVNRGDFVTAALQPAGAPNGAPLRWSIAIEGVNNSAVRERLPFALQLLRGGKVIVDEIVGRRTSRFEAGFHAQAGEPIAIRLVAIVDCPEDWGWGTAAAVVVSQCEVRSCAPSERDAYVSSLTATLSPDLSLA